MSRTRRSIGSDGLEQGGMDLGNDISRKDLSIKNAGDALTDPPIMSGDSNQPDLEDNELDDDAVLPDDELIIDDEDDVLDDDDSALLAEDDDDMVIDDDDIDDEQDKNL